MHDANTLKTTWWIWLLCDMKPSFQAVPKRGEEPEQDALEKALLKTATRGVVRLFNAVSKAQRDQKDALVGGSRSRVCPHDLHMFAPSCPRQHMHIAALMYTLWRQWRCPSRVCILHSVLVLCSASAEYCGQPSTD